MAAVDSMDLRSLHDWVVRPQLRNTPGVTEVNAIGGYVRQIHVTPDPARLLAYGFTLDDVVDALTENNQNVSAGYIERNGQQLLVRVPNQAPDIAALETIVLDRRDGVPIRVSRRRDGRRRAGAAHRRRHAERRGSRARHA